MDDNSMGKTASSLMESDNEPHPNVRSEVRPPCPLYTWGIRAEGQSSSSTSSQEEKSDQSMGQTNEWSNVDDFNAKHGVEASFWSDDTFLLARRRQRNLVDPNSEGQHKKTQRHQKNTVCVFCRNNGENLPMYSSHSLRDSFGRVTCPVLHSYVCPVCGASGSEAHTLKYCPYNTTYRWERINYSTKTPKKSKKKAP